MHARTGQHNSTKPQTAPDREVRLYTVRSAVAGGPVPANELMSLRDLIKEIVSTYQKHGWELRRALLRPETSAELAAESFSLAGVRVEEAAVDGLWFSRPSHEQREAWELRLLAENPFALFETFEQDETEDQREEMRLEMEARLRDYVNPVMSNEY